MVLHFYLYFPSEVQARRAGDELAGDRVTVDIRLGADDVNWLVLVHVPETRERLDHYEEVMFDIARRYGGEHDGYEVEL